MNKNIGDRDLTLGIDPLKGVIVGNLFESKFRSHRILFIPSSP